MRTTILPIALLFALGACSDDSEPTPTPDGAVPGDAIAADVQPQADTQQEADTQQLPEKVEDVVPGDNFVAGWTASGPVDAAYTQVDIEALINGAHDPYHAKGCAGYAQRSYENGDLTMNLKIWEMNEAASAKEMFDYEKTQSGLTFEPITGVSDDASIGQEGMARWWAFAHTGRYVYKMDGNATAADNVETVKAAVSAFISSLAATLPTN